MFIFFVLSQFKSFSKSQLKQEPSLVPKDQKYRGNSHLTAKTATKSHANNLPLLPSAPQKHSCHHQQQQLKQASDQQTKLLPFVPCSCFVVRKHLSLPSCISWPLTGKLLGNHSSNCQKDTTAEFLTHSYPLHQSFVPSAILFALLPQLCQHPFLYCAFSITSCILLCLLLG